MCVYIYTHIYIYTLIPFVESFIHVYISKDKRLWDNKVLCTRDTVETFQGSFPFQSKGPSLSHWYNTKHTEVKGRQHIHIILRRWGRCVSVTMSFSCSLYFRNNTRSVWRFIQKENPPAVHLASKSQNVSTLEPTRLNVFRRTETTESPGVLPFYRLKSWFITSKSNEWTKQVLVSGKDVIWISCPCSSRHSAPRLQTTLTSLSSSSPIQRTNQYLQYLQNIQVFKK